MDPTNTLLVFILVHTPIIVASISGLYVDNGIDQTVQQRRFAPNDARYVETDLLHLLDLPNRPPRRHRKFRTLRSSASVFLTEVYRKLNDNSDEHRIRTKPRVIVSPNMTSAVLGDSDWITTFVNKRHHAAEMHHERGTQLWFDVSHVKNDTHLLLGILRIYQSNKLSKWRADIRKYAVTVFAMTDSKGDQTFRQPLTTVNTTSDFRGWLQFNVSTALDNWLNASGSNHGLYIEAHTVQRPDYKVRLADIGLVKAHGGTSVQPFLVGYFKRTTPLAPITHQRVRRDASSANRRRPMHSDRHSDPFHELLESIPPKRPKSCQISSLFVSFKDLQWQDWIIAPNGYAASYCGGECNFPLSYEMNATNHAIVQMLVHLYNPVQVPKPLCAPTKLASISVLYFNDESNVNMKTFPDMTVQHCGCH